MSVDIEKQKKLGEFVANEVFCNQSMLVEGMLQKGVFNIEDIENFYKSQKETLQEMTKEALLEILAHEDLINEFKDNTEEQIIDKILEIQEQGDIDELETDPQEIYEWWIVSAWLLHKLKKHGEPIMSNDYGDWWGRCATGQAIKLDYIIEKIYDENS